MLPSSTPKSFRGTKKISHMQPSSLSLQLNTEPRNTFLSVSAVMYAVDDFAGKSPTDLLDFLQQKNLSESLVQLYTLVCLAVTIPVSTASVKRTFSALKQLKLMPEK